MTLVLLAQIRCDATGCPTGRWGAEPKELWGTLRGEGWTRDGEQHHCPTHSPEDPRLERIRELAGRGLSDANIGAKIGMSRGGVQSLRQAHGIPGRRPGRPNSTREVVPR